MIKHILIFLSAVFIVSAFPDKSSRIVGGDRAQLGQVPFQASLRAWGTTFHFAGGALLNNRWVLTIAHKVSGRANNSINIVLGIILITASGTNRRSDQIHVHPNFSFETMANDIALVRLTSTISFSQTIQPIFMHANRVESVGLTAQISGFGATETDKGENSNDLMILTVVIESNEACVAAHGSRITDNHICTIGRTPSTGFCTSDVGGPLILNAELIGIASWHPLPCGSSGHPDAYMRISSYRTWINSITGL